MANNEVKNPMAQNVLIPKVAKRLLTMKQSEGLQMPPNYSVGNALNSAYLMIQDIPVGYGKTIFDTCTHSSIYQALLNMAIQGLSPSKHQCYFIKYGDKLTMTPSYFGNVAALKRLEEIKDVKAQAIFEGDKFEIGTDEDFNLVVKEYAPRFENRDSEIIGAFAVIFKTDGTRDYTVMTKKEIEQSWDQSRQKNNKVQNNFGQEMAQRTVLNRASKFYINTSDDSDLLAQSLNETVADQYEDDDRREVVVEEKKTVSDLVPEPEKPEKKPKESVSPNTEAVESAKPAKETKPASSKPQSSSGAKSKVSPKPAAKSSAAAAKSDDSAAYDQAVELAKSEAAKQPRKEAHSDGSNEAEGQESLFNNINELNELDRV